MHLLSRLNAGIVSHKRWKHAVAAAWKTTRRRRITSPSRYLSLGKKEAYDKRSLRKFISNPTIDSTLQFATAKDVEGIHDLFKTHGTGSLHLRSKPYISSMIDRNAVIVSKDSNGEIDATLEALLLTTKDQIDEFYASCHTPGAFNPPYQPDDLVLYLGGGLRKKDSPPKFYEKAAEFIRNHFHTNTWTESRLKWEERGGTHSTIEHHQGDSFELKDDTTVERPRRTIFAFGVMNDEKGNECRSNTLFSRVWPSRIQNTTYTYRQNCKAPDGTGREGTFYFQVHDVPMTRHQKERTKRNRYLITSTEQKRLLGTRIGFVGLSTGSVALEALLREGIGGIYRIADFDTFETSNSNRMLFGTSCVDRSKVELCAERIKSIDPDIIVEKFSNGLSADNVSDFVKDCDIIIEECDDFAIKVMLRREAKKFRRPLLMATSQNGMIDVERYDTEVETQPFHMDDQSILDEFLSPTLSAKEKHKMLSKIFSHRSLSARFIRSSMELGKSISSWPQLAEEVFLNAATLTHATRRILLGDKGVVSGRFSILMDKLFSPSNRIATHDLMDLKPPGLATSPRDPHSTDADKMNAIQELLFVNHWARDAPCIGDQQFWNTRLCIDSGDEAEPRIDISLQKESCSIYRFDKNLKEKWLDLALGCLLENADIAAAHLGKSIDVTSNALKIDSSAPIATSFVMKTHYSDDSQDDDQVLRNRKRLFHAMRHRLASPLGSSPITQMPPILTEVLRKMGVVIVEESGNNGTHPPSIKSVRSSIVRERTGSIKDLHRIFEEVGGDQLKFYPFMPGLSGDEKVAIEKLISKSPDELKKFVSNQSFYKAMVDPFKEEIDRTKVFMIICDEGDDFVQKGRLLERVWLEITYHGYGVRPFSLRTEQIEHLGVPKAFFVFSLVEPHHCVPDFTSPSLE